VPVGRWRSRELALAHKEPWIAVSVSYPVK
jgi:hypothetical protein